MTNMNTRDEYWQNKRVVAGMERNKEETLKVIKDVNVEYKKKLKDIKHEIADFYAKYGKGDVLDYSKITSKLDDKDFNTMIRDWDKFVKKYPDMERFRDIRMNYYKLDRLQGLSNRIALHVAELGKTEEEMLKLLATDGKLVKRPMIVTKDFVLNGFKEEEWKEKLKK